jgi:hypothetical protein
LAHSTISEQENFLVFLGCGFNLLLILCFLRLFQFLLGFMLFACSKDSKRILQYLRHHFGKAGGGGCILELID